MGGEESKLLYDQLLAGLRKGYKGDKVQTGVFGAMMQVGASDSPPQSNIGLPGGADQRWTGHIGIGGDPTKSEV